MGLGRSFIDLNRRCSRAFDRVLTPEKFRVDGNRDFIDNFAKKYLRPGMTVFDVGGGKQPYINRATKEALGLTVVGLDIDANELARAPAGLYDQTICADITKFTGNGTADLLVCQALLEHVKDVSAAFRSIASILRPGGQAVIFVPSRNALLPGLISCFRKHSSAGFYSKFSRRPEQTQAFPAITIGARLSSSGD